jgi:hypothetical protein
MQTSPWIIATLWVIGTANCSDREPGGTTDGSVGAPDDAVGLPDGSGSAPDGSVLPPDGSVGVSDGEVPDRASQVDADAGICCPIDTKPGCCMNYGGSRQSWGCAVACDGMAWPNDPRWEKRKDEHGCEYWVDPPFDPAYGVCGGLRPEAGVVLGDAPPDAEAPRDVTSDADASDASDGGLCCPIDPKPGCCMNYGGSRQSWGCGPVCDGMAWPNDPRWQKRIDEHRCEYWVDPPFDPAYGVCGAPRPEAGIDASTDVLLDTGSDRDGP